VATLNIRQSGTPARKERPVSELQGCLLILGFNIFLLIVNIGLLGIMVKIYTEAFKEIRHDRRERIGK
jgi:hypothetical protein